MALYGHKHSRRGQAAFGRTEPVKILLCGGGTGGHITPLLAVAHRLKALRPDIQLAYIGERRGKFTGIVSNHKLIDETRLIFAGKFRRYHGESFLRRLLDVKTNALNLRDLAYILIGIFQAFWSLLRLKPDAIFIKGGFVAVPVGIAARLLKIPFITHDSDTLPGLANRIIGRWALMHATGMPAEFYTYPGHKVRFVGVPLAGEYKPVTPKLQREAKQALGMPADAFLIVVTGGIQGARNINRAAADVVPALLDNHAKLYVVHHVGYGNRDAYQGFTHSRLQIEEYIPEFFRYLAAADIVVTRGSATTLAELAVLQKAAVIIPSPYLSGGHQLKNAEHIATAEAAVILDESKVLESPAVLGRALQDLMSNSMERQRLAENLAKLSKPDAAQELAKILLEISG